MTLSFTTKVNVTPQPPRPASDFIMLSKADLDKQGPSLMTMQVDDPTLLGKFRHGKLVRVTLEIDDD